MQHKICPLNTDWKVKLNKDNRDGKYFLFMSFQNYERWKHVKCIFCHTVRISFSIVPAVPKATLFPHVCLPHHCHGLPWIVLLLPLSLRNRFFLAASCLILSFPTTGMWSRFRISKLLWWTLLSVCGEGREDEEFCDVSLRSFAFYRH